VRRHTAAAIVLVAMLVACSDGDGQARPTTTTATGTSATSAPRTIDPQSPSLHLVTYNQLHGVLCDRDTDFCRAPDRIEILGRHLEAAGCPDLVGLQEVHPRQDELVADLAERVCGGQYEVASEPVESPDRSVVLSARPIVAQAKLDLAAFPWEAQWVRINTRLGPVDFLTAHFASSSNDPVCTPEVCPPALCPGDISANQCHARQVVDFLNRRPGPPAALAVVAGDLNATEDEPTLERLRSDGFRDTWELANQPACNPETEAGCTGASTEPPGELFGLDTEEGFRFGERIDYVLIRAAPTIDAGQVSAAPFAGDPLEEPVGGLYWASDHVGVQARVDFTRR
jgi:endonuclease/exonuclease/phosphatase family metal-dependent hydrolase